MVVMSKARTMLDSVALAGALAGIFAFASVASGCDTRDPATPAPPVDAGTTPVAPSLPGPSASPLELGRELYGRYCGFCHGAQGQGYAADSSPAIGNEEFLAIASDEFLRSAITRGRPGTVMSAWGKDKGGPLDASSVDALVLAIRAWQKRPYASVDALAVTGDAARGVAPYETHCKGCHGAEGAGGPLVSLSNPEFLATASDGFLATTLERGRPLTPMGIFTSVLDAQGRADVVALVRSWQKPIDTAVVPLPPAPGALGSVVLNPGGPEPNFDPAADFVPADLVKAELDRGATMVIADARAPSDYVAMHVRGAVSVPFYQVASYAPEVPKERFVVTYCACPHAISGQARDAFRALGYRSSVLDEGVLVWRDRGYPVRGGASP